MKLAGRNQVLPRLSLTEAVTLIQDAGYDALELSALRGTETAFPDIAEKYVIDHVKELCTRVPGFYVSALSCHANYATDDYIYGIQERLLRVAHSYGTDIVIMSTFVPFGDRLRHGEELYSRLIERTRKLCDIAERENVRIAIEVEPNQLFNNLDSFFRVAEAVGSPALGINFDIGHIFLSEPDVEAAIERCRGLIFHGHIDNMCRGEHCHMLPWEGDIDLLAACRALKAAGFDGTMALDLYFHDYASVSKQCADYIHRELFSRL